MTWQIGPEHITHSMTEALDYLRANGGTDIDTIVMNPKEGLDCRIEAESLDLVVLFDNECPLGAAYFMRMADCDPTRPCTPTSPCMNHAE